MRDRLPCEFFLIRYVPDVVKGEFVNIGVVLRIASEQEEAQCAVRFTRNWSRVRCLDAEADIALLEALEAEIGGRLRTGVDARDPKAVLDMLGDTLSNSVQMTDAKASLAENMTLEMEQLMRLYVEPLKVQKVRAKSGRAALAGTLRTEFERAGIWSLMRKRISAAMYTRAGDPLRIDCGYRPNGTIRMFHAVSLAGDLEAAKGLAFSASSIQEGVRRIEGARLELTAVVEPLRAVSVLEDEAAERYGFGVEMMERQEIRVVTLNDLTRAAETARREMGL